MTAEAAPTLTADAWQRVSAVVVTHHSGGVIRQCLERLGKAAKIVVIDNASDDDTIDIVTGTAPDSQFLRNQVGVGYGNAANQGLATVETEFALLVNPDAVVEPGAIEHLVAAADTYPDGVLFGPTIVNPDGSIEPNHDVKLFDRRIYAPHSDDSHPAGPCCAEFLSGAIHLLRISAYREIGPFDPNFFLYYEDDDYCMRLRNAGFSLIMVPDAVVRHIGGGSVRPSLHYHWEKYWHMAWSRQYFEEKYRGRTACRRLTRSCLLYFGGRTIGHVLTLRGGRAWRNLARTFGTAGYALGIPASRTTRSDCSDKS
jgi:GT2 family glycosyltransferase